MGCGGHLFFLLCFEQCFGSGSVSFGWIRIILPDLDPFQTIRIRVAPKTNQNHEIKKNVLKNTIYTKKKDYIFSGV